MLFVPRLYILVISASYITITLSILLVMTALIEGHASTELCL